MLGEMQRASSHTSFRDSPERQEMTVFPHQPEDLTAISVFLIFPKRSVFRLPCALEDPQKSPFTLSRETGVYLKVVMILLSGTAVISFSDEVKQSHL